MFPRLFSHKKALSRHKETEAADFRFSILILWGTKEPSLCFTEPLTRL